MKVRVKETEEVTYISCNFNREGIIHQVNLSFYPGSLQCEVVPPSFHAKELIKGLCQILGEPHEGPRVRESFSDCGEETGTLFAMWKVKRDEEILNRIIMHLKEDQ